ncbi:MAG: endonuclease/exonuclease/phosphatase family protein [Verrucomicrobia bacterium]|nr:endonuclease/exonuclease/phosphatase family protein [Verrucomicrobiota bacterium]
MIAIVQPSVTGLALVLGAFLLLPEADAQTESATLNPPLKVMSFNIRYGAADDGTNSWPHRRYLILETIRTFDPDLLGMQEVLASQADYLKDNLPDYAFHGVGREDGVAQGEFVPVLYKRDRFEWVDAGHFWLSETPDVPGSKSWDSSLPRMVSWAQGFSGKPLIDTYRVIHPERSPDESSTSRWTGVRQGRRIDWILHSADFTTLNAAINYTQELGRYPSDHYPVAGVLRLKR